jgi:hypothetical protein
LSSGFGRTVRIWIRIGNASALLNFSDKLQSINKIPSAWYWRDLTFIGKITVIKSLTVTSLRDYMDIIANPFHQLLPGYCVSKLFQLSGSKKVLIIVFVSFARF